MTREDQPNKWLKFDLRQNDDNSLSMNEETQQEIISNEISHAVKKLNHKRVDTLAHIQRCLIYDKYGVLPRFMPLYLS